MLGFFRKAFAHPALASTLLWGLLELIALQGDEGARRLIARYPSHAVNLDDPGVLVDVDTSEDLAQLRRRIQPAAS